MGLLAIVRNMLFSGFRRNSVVRADEDLDHYALYAGVFREEFEVEGKRAFYFCHAGTGYDSRNDSFHQATPILADLLMPGLIQYIIEYPNYVLERDYYGLPVDCEIPESLDKTEQKHFAETNADIILLMDYDHCRHSRARQNSKKLVEKL